MSSNLKQELIKVAKDALESKGHKLDPVMQIDNIISYAASSLDFQKVITSTNPKVIAELKSQIRYICRLGLDTAKGRSLVYVRTRNVNVGDRNNPVWLTMPDISESYHASILIFKRTKIIENIVVKHIYENYPVEYDGELTSTPKVQDWKVKPSDRGDYTGCFVILDLFKEDGSIVKQTSFHHAEDIAATHRKFSKSSSTWENHRLAMTAKSAIMDSTKYLVKDDEDVISMIEHYDESHDWDKLVVDGDPITTEQFKILTDLLETKATTLPRLEKLLIEKEICETLAELPVSKYDDVYNRNNDLKDKS